MIDYTKLKRKIWGKWACWDIGNYHCTITDDPDATAQEWLASRMGIPALRLKNILNNQAEFSGEEIEKACAVLEIPAEFISVYFFTVMSTPTNKKIISDRDNVIKVNFA